ncbi:MAG: endonuclease/exonuclease/phosphatase family protein [candidate division Kazan bacterium GW2011_GWA1_50_15]|uniref:Endonuclease/exonuclease/phosphatase family protein n=2 Tax=Bacteria division Kazan-3B-28 TaxID=1798534 RepID=A0A0G4BAX2_UNCK3|nr:MAG: endonuclease/exonuclease/phosphatase family protein [candidate division Kazan bacterium GW2011_GWA1_50_15]HAV65984.1 hypothetical protein [Patescibacteria group bacterium]HCR42552.1 hypothetical protein [Patescibacteria group bacterium]
MIKQTQKFFVRLLERELMTVLAVLIAGSFVWWARASDTANVTFSLTVENPGGSVTVLTPDGGESWAIGSSQNITWETTGTVTDVLIEIQRTTGGSWTTIVASTTNDGSYPWTVTQPATSQASIRITEVGDGTVTDISDAVFSIVSSGGGGGGGVVYPAPAIDNVTPSTISNRAPVTLDIRGVNFREGVYFRLDASVDLSQSTFINDTTATAVVPAGLAARDWHLWVFNTDGSNTIWGTPITIVTTQYDAILQQDLPAVIRFYLHPSETGRIVLPFTNYGNYTWDTRLKLGTIEPDDHNSVLYHAPTWPTRNRAIGYTGGPVGYGSTIELPLTVQAPLQAGTYTDKFKLVLDGVAWLTMTPITVEVIVSSEIKPPPTTGGEELTYSAKFVAKSPNPRVTAGGEAELWVEFENTGTAPWRSSGLNPVRLGTTHVRDRESRLAHSTWIINRNRVATADDTIVEPGEIGRFAFKVQAPTRTGVYREWFGLVAEFKQWFSVSAETRWDISVVRPTAVRSLVPSTGGSQSPAPTTPATQVFQDTTEQLWRTITQGINQVLGSIGSLFRSWF